MIKTALGGSGYFVRCDGYQTPSTNTDRMTVWGGLFTPKTEQPRQTPTFGVDGVGACGAALQTLDSAYKQYWMRKISVLQARAMHRLAIADGAGAAKDLDEAEALAAAHADDRLFDRSLRLGLTFVRAYALRQAGETERSRAMAIGAWESRPFARETAGATLVVLGPKVADADVRRLLMAEGQIDPRASNHLFEYEFARGRAEEALAVYGGLTPAIEVNYSPTASREYAWSQQVNRALLLEFWLASDARRAFALASLNRLDEARAALKVADDRIAAELVPPPPLPADASAQAKMLAVVREQGDLQIQTRVQPSFAAVRDLVLARIELGEGKTARAEAVMQKPLNGFIGADLAAGLAAKIPSYAPRAAELKAKMAAIPPVSAAAEMKNLFGWLPEPESAARVPAEATAGIWRLDGYHVSPPAPGRDDTVVTFRGLQGSPTVLEELALLRSADMALAAGKDGLLVLDYRNIRNTLTTYMYGRALRTDPTGYTSMLDVVFIDRAHPPEAYKDAGWRMLDAHKVHDTLSPIYGTER